MFLSAHVSLSFKSFSILVPSEFIIYQSMLNPVLWVLFHLVRTSFPEYLYSQISVISVLPKLVAKPKFHGEHLGNKKDTTKHHWGQLGHNFRTTFGQLRDNIRTTKGIFLVLLWDNDDDFGPTLRTNIEIGLRKLWNNLRITFGQLRDISQTTVGQFWDYKVVTIHGACLCPVGSKGPSLNLLRQGLKPIGLQDFPLALVQSSYLCKSHGPEGTSFPSHPSSWQCTFALLTHNLRHWDFATLPSVPGVVLINTFISPSNCLPTCSADEVEYSSSQAKNAICWISKYKRQQL